MRTVPAIELVLYALVIGAVLVSFAAFYESRTHYNVFHHLNNWVPFLKPARVFTETNRIRGRPAAASRRRRSTRSRSARR